MYSNKKQNILQSLKLNSNHIAPTTSNSNESANQQQQQTQLPKLEQARRQSTQLPLLNALQSQIISSNSNFLKDISKDQNNYYNNKLASHSVVDQSTNNFRKQALINNNNNLEAKEKSKKEIKLRDFQCLEKISEIEMESIDLPYLKKLYMLNPKNTKSILYRLQKKQNSYFDGTTYTQTMEDIFENIYQLPGLVRRHDANDKSINTSHQPYDELFIWSLLLYGGDENDKKLMKHFWLRAKYPMACCFVAIIVYNFLARKKFMPDDLKEKILDLNKEFEKMAIDIMNKCNETNLPIAQDLIICEIDIFYNHTVLELASKANAKDFVSLAPVQQLLDDVWFDKLNPHLSFWQILLPYLFFPFLFSPINYFRSDVSELSNQTDLDERTSRISLRNNFNEYSKATRPEDGETEASGSGNYATESGKKASEQVVQFQTIPNEDLSYRDLSHHVTGLNRLYHYFNAPVVKFINHFVFYIVFLLLFSGFLLFDYYPEEEVKSTVIRITVGDKVDYIKVTITELLVNIFVGIYLFDEVRELIVKKSTDKKIVSKIKDYYFENKWNIFDSFIFIVYYTAFTIRFSPVLGYVFELRDENCYEIARVLFSISSILWYTKIFQMFSCVPFWGPKFIIMKAMLKKLAAYIIIVLIFLIPFGVAFESIMNKTQKFSLETLTSSFNRAFWVMFGELLEILQEFEKFQCRGEEIVNHEVSIHENSTHHVFVKEHCKHNFSSALLYLGFGFYTITCHLLILNMIIATFTTTQEEIDIISHKVFKFYRYEGVKDIAEKALLPPPLVVLEYVYNISCFAKRQLSGQGSESIDSFKIENMDSAAKNVYIRFETNHRNRIILDDLNHANSQYHRPNHQHHNLYKGAFHTRLNTISENEKETSSVVHFETNNINEIIIQSINKLEDNINLMKLWMIEQQNELKNLILNKN